MRHQYRSLGKFQKITNRFFLAGRAHHHAVIYICQFNYLFRNIAFRIDKGGKFPYIFTVLDFYCAYFKYLIALGFQTSGFYIKYDICKLG